jgi:hypothetical protein
LDDPEGMVVHWVASEGRKGQTLPCDDRDCRHCKAGIPPQTAWYVSALVWVNRPGVWVHEILALTDFAKKMLAAKARRGTLVLFKREPGRANAPLFAEVKGVGLEETPGEKGEARVALPEPENVRAVLRARWNLPPEPMPQQPSVPLRDTRDAECG